MPKLNWHYFGPDHNEVGRTRAWFFPGNRRCVQFDLEIEDQDGDRAFWKIEQDKRVIFAGECRDMDEAEDNIERHLDILRE
jgi:hypothetical protein